MNPKPHSALVRGDDGGLEVRSFNSRQDADAAAAPREIVPESVFKIDTVLPQILEHMRLMQSRKIRVVPLALGGFEIELVETNRLFVSRQELADMMPRFSENTNPTRYVDELVKKGLPHIRATGSAIFNVPKVVAWLEKWFAAGGSAPAAR